MGLESLTDAELQELQTEFEELAKEKLAARESKPPSGSRDRHTPGHAHAHSPSQPPAHQAGISNTSSSTTGSRSSRAT
jgi:hypothetical protein